MHQTSSSTPSLTQTEEILKTGENETPLQQALRVLYDLKQGAALVDTAVKDHPICAFSIGTMLHHMIRKELVDSIFITEEYITRLLTESGLTKKKFLKLNRDLVIDVLENAGHVDSTVPRKELKPPGTLPAVKDIAKIVEDRNDISVDMLLSETRIRKVVDARFEMMWIMRHVCGFSLSMIGRNLGGRDHTTAMNGLERVATRYRQDYGYKARMEKMCEMADLAGVKRHRAILCQHHDFFNKQKDIKHMPDGSPADSVEYIPKKAIDS